MMKIILGPNQLMSDLLIDKVKIDSNSEDISFFKFKKNSSKTDKETNIKLANDLVSRISFIDPLSFLSPDLSDNTSSKLTIAEVHDDKLFLEVLNLLHNNDIINIVEKNNDLILRCHLSDLKHSSNKLDELEKLNLVDIYKFEAIKSENQFLNFINNTVTNFNLSFDSIDTENEFKNILVNTCKCQVSKKGEYQSISTYTRFNDIRYNDYKAYNIMINMISYTQGNLVISLDNLSKFFNRNEVALSNRILSKIFDCDNAKQAANKLIDELTELNRNDLRAFLGYFNYSIKEYLKYEDGDKYNKYLIRVYNKIRPTNTLLLTEHLSDLQTNYTISNESIITSLHLYLKIYFK